MIINNNTGLHTLRRYLADFSVLCNKADCNQGIVYESQKQAYVRMAKGGTVNQLPNNFPQTDNLAHDIPNQWENVSRS